VKVLGISVNAADLYSLRGKPCSHGPLWVAAAQQQILGVDIVGQVEAAGNGPGSGPATRSMPTS